MPHLGKYSIFTELILMYNSYCLTALFKIFKASHHLQNKVQWFSNLAFFFSSVSHLWFSHSAYFSVPSILINSFYHLFVGGLTITLWYRLQLQKLSNLWQAPSCQIFQKASPNFPEETMPFKMLRTFDLSLSDVWLLI